MLDSSETLTVERDTTAPPVSLWRAVRESVRGSHRRDYTQGDVGRAVILLAVPMVLEMLMESVFAVCDVFFVAHLGADAVATVGLTESMLTIVYTVAIGLSIGATAMVARRIGEHDGEGAARTAWQVIVLGLVVSLVLGATGVLLAPRLLRLMGASPGVLTHVNYMRMMLGGCASVVLLFLINAVFRGAGDAAIAMRVLWLANAINITLGPCLIFGLGPFPKLGVTGAAIATTIGRATGALFAFSRLWRANNSHVRLARRHLRVVPAIMLRLIRLSGAGTLQVFIGTASWIGLIRLISTFGSDALAGYTIGIRIILFALLPSWGMSNAAATMVGQALGARKPERAEQAVWRAGLYNMCVLGTVGLIFVLLAPQITSLFTQEPAVLYYATNCLRIVACGFLFYAYGMVLTQSFNGAGDTWTPTYLNLFVFWLWEIPLAYVLAFHTTLGPRGIFLAITLAFSTLAVVSAVLFKRGTWKAKVV
ncbi:MAG: MATE family efflux transporter [Pyrinomonadaceae bacterium]